MGDTSQSEALHEITGTVEKVVYKNSETGFIVFYLTISAQQKITATGTLPDLFQGEIVFLKGHWRYHAKFGQQFEVKECSSKTPTNVIGIKKYLASGLIKGIGPKFAERLVDKFGEATLEIIEHEPHRLSEVGGVGPRRVEMIAQAWAEQKEISKVMIFLRAKDVSTSFAVKIFKKYGNQAIPLMQENPYRLVEDIWGIGFKSADQIALKLGLAPDSIERIKACIIYTITEATNNGHLYLEVPRCKENVIELIALDAQGHQPLLKQALQELYTQQKIKLISYQDHHFVTLPQFYFSEKGIAKKIIKVQSVRSDKRMFDYDAIYQQLRQVDARGIELNEDQQRGILSCLQNQIAIVTGGPGTGKTTLVKKFLEVLDTTKQRFRLAAPTGRAAKRMFEGTGRNTETIHRLLEFTPGLMGFARNEQNALDLDFLIIDEASMIDVFLMHAILRALPDHAHLVLLGDVDQLPSVGAGNVLNDLIASEKVSVIRLTQIFRQAQDSMIIVNAHKVNKGDFPTSTPQGKKDFFFVKEEEPEKTYGLLQNIFKKKLGMCGIKAENAVVLVPMNRGTVGTQRLNQELQMILNPQNNPEKQVMRFATTYKIGDRVMQIRNNYDKFVFNGDIGNITDIDQDGQKIKINFGDRELEYEFSELDEIVLSYAISIHKSQGSEFDAVIIPLFMQHFILLQRNLLYTAITRAKKLCILVGQPKAVAMAIKNNKGVERVTFLKEFLTTDLAAR